MGLSHTVALGYGFEIPNDAHPEDIDRALADQPQHPDSIGYLVIGDYDRMLLVTRCERVGENEVVRLTPDTLTAPAVLADWDNALHDTAVRLGYPDHPAPTWLVIHNHR